MVRRACLIGLVLLFFTVVPTVTSAGEGTWIATGSMVGGRLGHTATLLLTGKVLFAGGMGAPGYLASAELYDPATGTFTATGAMQTPREYHTATLLPTGEVLIAGGYGASGALASAELYDPVTGTFTATGSMGASRAFHTATLLPNGKVLIVGRGGGGSASAELYDPAAGTFSNTGSMHTTRSSHTATLLLNGKVLIVGGCCEGSSSTPLNSAELYDPATGTFSVTGPMNDARWERHAAILLPSGKVLIAGGGGISAVLASAELYDPATGTFSYTGSMTQARAFTAAALLPNGKVLIAGGALGTAPAPPVASAELYDPVTETFSSAGSMGTSREEHTATLLQTGKILIAGGGEGASSPPLASAEIYCPEMPGTPGAWIATGSMVGGQLGHTATLLLTGKVLFAGGMGAPGYLASAELYDPATGAFTATGAMQTPREYHTATLLPTGEVLIAGGYGASGALASAELYDPAAGTFTATGSMGASRAFHTATLLPNGKVLIVGQGGGPGSASAELYDPAAGTFSNTGSMHTTRSSHTATLLLNGKVLIAGGYGASGALASAELYDPVTGTFSVTGPMNDARWERHAAILLPSGKVLIAGGGGISAVLASAELYDPATGTFSYTGSMAQPRAFTAAALLPNGKVLIAGGALGTAPAPPVASAELYDPVTETFSSAGSMGTSREEHTATLLQTGKILIAGGGEGGSSPPLASAELYSTAVCGPVCSVSPTGTGSGLVTSSPAGISCPGDCSEEYDIGTSVTLTATADATSTFVGWSGGGCSGTGTCTVTMDAAKSVTATFDLLSFSLTVSKSGSGTVTSTPAGIDCGSTCTASFAPGTSVTLTATAANGWTFVGWSGACTGTGGCTVTLTQARTVTAIFNTVLPPPSYSLTVTKGGTGTGTVTSLPPSTGITCGSACSASFESGTTVTLAATADAGSSFAGWTGEGCSGTGTCTVAMTQARYVTGTFSRGTLFGITTNAGAATLVTVDPVAGSVAPVASVPGLTGGVAQGVSALDPTTHRYFVVGADSPMPPLNQRLFVIDTQTGTVVANPVLSQVPTSLQFEPTTGTLFGITTNAGAATLVTVDPVAGSVAPVASVPGLTGGVAQGVSALDPTTHRYFVVGADSPMPPLNQRLFVIDTQTGTVVANPVLSQVPTSLQFEPTAAPPVALSVTKAGMGTGTITGPGINCGSDCNEAYASGAPVTLTATADATSTFVGWSGGGCSGTGTCTVTMDAAKTITATFDLQSIPLTVIKGGSGMVTSAPAGINCGPTCGASFSYGTSVTLTATAANGWTFTGWSGGGCSGTGTCTVTMDAEKAVTATFDQLRADVGVSQAAAPDPATAGQPLTYTITVRNLGPYAATGVILTDTLPNSVTFVSATPSQGSCSGTAPVTCPLGTLAPTASATVRIVVTAPTVLGSLTNTAVVTATEPDPNTGNNSTTISTTVVNTPAGNNVTVQPPDPTTGTTPVILTFSNVTQPGVTTLTTSDNGPVPPTGFQLGNPPRYYELATTATYTGSIAVCINYAGVSYGDESSLRLFHIEGGTWVDRTTSLNTTTKTICGQVTSLSPFAIFEPVPPPDTTLTSFPPALTNTASASFIFTATKPGCTFECQLDGGGFSACTTPKTYSGLSDGAHIFQVRAVLAGTVDPTPASYTWTVDTTPPAIGAVSNQTVEATSAAGAVVSFAVTATDAIDPAPVVTASPSSGSTFLLGTTMVTVTARDAAGNVSTQSFTVTVQDTTPPVIGAVSNVTTTATSPAGAVVTFALPTAADTVDPSPVVTSSPASGSTFPLGTTTVTVSARDASGNVSTKTFTITVRDTTPPVLTVPANLTREATSAAGAVATFTVSATDAVDPSPVVSASPPSGSTFPIGVTTVTVTARDASNNISTKSFTITVRDTTPPVIGSVSNVTATATSPAGAVVTFALPTATDAVDPSPVVSASPASGSTFPIGVTTVTVTAKDAANNASTKTFTVTVTEPSPTPGMMLGEGWLDQGGKRSQYAFEVREKATGADRGHLQLSVRALRPGRDDNDRDDVTGPADQFESTLLTDVVFYDLPGVRPGGRVTMDTVAFKGIGRWNGATGYAFTATATDAGEPGAGRDRFAITITAPNGTAVVSVSGIITGGNNQSNRVTR